MIYSKLIAHGSYLPEKTLSNAEIVAKLDTSDEWIVQRTGIKNRHIAAENEKTSHLAIKALENAMKKSAIDPASIDGIIVATTTPDMIFPSTASIVQGAVLKSNAFSMDINAVCCGFIYALKVADSLIKSGSAKRIAVIGAEVMSRIVDWNDRSTCILFGDGAGALILEGAKEPGILASNFYSNGECGGILTAYDSKIYMEGKEVFKHAVSKMVECSNELLDLSRMDSKDIDWLIPHQANQRILTAVADKLGIEHSKLVSTVANHANTSAASIPLAFSQYADTGHIKPGNIVLMPAVGGGLTWGSVLIKV